MQYPARPLATREEFENNIIHEQVIRPAYYIYVGEIHDALIFGDEDLFAAGDYLLSDRTPQNNHYYLSRNILEITQNSAVVKNIRNPEIIERGIDLVKMWSGNYYHFSFEVMARLQLIDAIEKYRDYPLILDEAVLHNKWNRQLLEMINTYNHPIITVKIHVPYLVHELIYPSFLNWHERNSGYAPRMHTMAAEYLREKIMNAHKPSRNYKNVYIARNDNIRLLNNEEVIECFKRYGIEIITQGTEDYSRTLDAFMTADNIIGIVGTNMVTQTVSKPEANIYIIAPFEYESDNAAYAVTDASRRKLQFIPAKVNQLGPVLNQTNFYVDINRIESLAKKLSQ